MTAKADFSADEWETVLKGPPAAALMIASSQRGGTFRESYSIAKGYAEARKQHGASQLLDDIVGEKPRMERPHVKSVDELKQDELKQLRESVSVVEQKAGARRGRAVQAVHRRARRAGGGGASRGLPRIHGRARLGRRAPGGDRDRRRARRGRTVAVAPS